MKPSTSCLIILSALCLALTLSATGAAATGGDASLPDAVKQKDTETVHTLLSRGADVNEAQPDGATALHWAAYWDDVETAQLLIRTGANATATNDYGVTPLWLACQNGSRAMVKLLLAANANPNGTMPSGETMLMRCARSGGLEAATALVEHGADVNARENKNGQTAVMWAVSEKHSDVAQALITHGADLHIRSKNGFTPLLFAARSGDVASARVLLAAGAAVDEGIPVKSQNKDQPPANVTPLLMASASGNEELSIFLLEHGANPNAWDGGAAPLHYAVMEGVSYFHRREPMFDLIKALLAHGANPNARFIRSNVVGRGYDTSNAGGRGATPFLKAAAAPNPAVMRILLQGGADPQLANEQNVTPLMAAAGVIRNEAFTEQEQKQALEALKVLVQLGANVNAKDKKGRTALHGATVMVADPVIQFLAEHGADLNAKDIYQQTPLSAATGVHLPWVPTGDELGEEGARRNSTADLLLKLGATPLETPGYFTPVATDSDAYKLAPRQGKGPATQ